MKGKILLLLFLLSMSLVTSAMTGVVKAQVEPPKVCFNPPIITGAPGDFIDVNVTVSGVSSDRGVNAWQVLMRWDYTLLYTHCGMIREGDFLRNFGYTGGITCFWWYPYLYLACSLWEPVTAYGSGTLVTISFKVLGEGETILDLHDTILWDFWLIPIPHTVEDGYFSNVPPEQTVQALSEAVETWDLPAGTESSLTSKLDDVLGLLEKGNEKGVIQKLTDFINQVEAMREKKLTNEQADYLIAKAQRIIDLIKE